LTILTRDTKARRHRGIPDWGRLGAQPGTRSSLGPPHPDSVKKFSAFFGLGDASRRKFLSENNLAPESSLETTYESLGPQIAVAAPRKCNQGQGNSCSMGQFPASDECRPSTSALSVLCALGGKYYAKSEAFSFALRWRD